MKGRRRCDEDQLGRRCRDVRETAGATGKREGLGNAGQGALIGIEQAFHLQHAFGLKPLKSGRVVEPDRRAATRDSDGNRALPYHRRGSRLPFAGRGRVCGPASSPTGLTESARLERELSGRSGLTGSGRRWARVARLPSDRSQGEPDGQARKCPPRDALSDPASREAPKKAAHRAP